MTITRIRTIPGGTDEYGDPIPGTVTETEIAGAFVAPRTSQDIDGRGRAGVVIGLTLYTPARFDLAAADQVRVAGEGVNDGLYEIEGQPGDWNHPWNGWDAGQVASLRRAEG